MRHLLSQSEGSTAILLSGGSLARISEAARMAGALQPSIAVLEDCGLIAEDRSFGHGPQPLLFEVLDAMDGLYGRLVAFSPGGIGYRRGTDGGNHGLLGPGTGPAGGGGCGGG